jgi:hypothetical protein
MTLLAFSLRENAVRFITMETKMARTPFSREWEENS